MRRIIAMIVLLVIIAGAAMADTLYLKNGSVLKGTFIGYENGQFIFELTNGNRLKFRPSEVSRLLIERETPVDDRNRPSAPEETGAKWETFSPIDVRLEDQWIRSTITVSRGQRVRIEASGTVYLDGKTATNPDGLSGRHDPDAPMPNENDGALIAAVGQDANSPAILIGRSKEFIAEYDGLLYFTVNHWETRDARGSFRINVSVDRSYGAAAGQTTPQSGREKTITVNANQQWTDTGIDVEPNMTFEIVAEGQIEIGRNNSAGPDGNRDANVSTSTYPIQDAPVGALIAKIRYRDGRDSNYVLIGSRGNPSSEPNEYGRLILGINDDYFRDNKGSFTVRIRW